MAKRGEDFPSTGARDGFACFEVNLEDFLIAEIDGFRDLLQAVAGEMRWKAKSPEVYTEVIERIGSDDLPKLLGAVIERVMEWAQRQVAT